jgi:tripartite-type tricarboxylate transporter receptor subunit TctC
MPRDPGVKRRSLLLGAAALPVAGRTGVAKAQGTAWPTPTVTIVVPYPPGGSADILARALAEKLGERLGRTVLVDNRAGAGTAIGAKAVAGAKPDGATLLMGTVTSQAINPAMAKVGYDPVADFTAVAPLCSIPFVLVAHPSLGVATVAELLAAAKAKPGAIAYASAGQGTSNHLAGELFAAATQTKFLHVPYKGSAPALNDTLAGHTPLIFDLQATALPHVQAGRLRALAVTSKARTPKLPNVPTLVEAGLAGYEVTAWFGVFAPAGLPAPVAGPSRDRHRGRDRRPGVPRPPAGNRCRAGDVEPRCLRRLRQGRGGQVGGDGEERRHHSRRQLMPPAHATCVRCVRDVTHVCS